MATSSIFAQVRIDDPKKAEAFIDAYVDAMEHSKERHYEATGTLLTDHEEIRKWLSKGDKND